ncbi:hypothetical protein PCANC_08155 [Puccinia coronata f. sp. avenae]|uniref:Uncharacterized protein n=1 Tax=Puccinia coronata f. sp. avenae TaxID=200324 RepID=A0A2N5VLW4_9BASI|nr:hypothetical protein PCANC_08155 [Puccinia coronata f. sp. avenae]
MDQRNIVKVQAIMESQDAFEVAGHWAKRELDQFLPGGDFGVLASAAAKASSRGDAGPDPPNGEALLISRAPFLHAPDQKAMKASLYELVVTIALRIAPPSDLFTHRIEWIEWGALHHTQVTKVGPATNNTTQMALESKYISMYRLEIHCREEL